VARAKEIIESYRARFQGIDAFLTECVASAKRTGHATTITGRWRPIPQIESRNPAERAFGERIAINTVVQGSAADLIKIAMVRMQQRLVDAGLRTRMLLQVHDELLFEAPTEEVEAAIPVIRDTMEHVWDLRVPLVVDLHHGASWAALK
jgi:DNA polymerase-1